MMPFDDLRLGNGVRLDAVIAPEQTAQNAVRNGYPVRILEGVYPFRSPAVVIADKATRNGPLGSVKSSKR